MLELTPDHKAISDLATQFIENEINPHSLEWEEQGQLPTRELFTKLGELGLLGINKPAEYGGLEMDFSYHAMFAEALGKLTSTGVALAIGVQTDMATPALARFGSHELKAEFLRPAIAGTSIAALGISEIASGSDVLNIKTLARKDGSDYVVNGSKMWMTNGCQADWICALVNTRDTDGMSSKNLPLSKSLMIIPTNLKGVSIGKKLNKIGMHSSDTAQVFFDNVRVPERNIVGSEGRGFIYQMKQFCDERLSICLSTIAMMRDTLERTIEYCRERSTFGQPLISNQAVQFRLSNLFADVETLRVFAWDTVEKFDAGKSVDNETAILKLKTGRLVRTVNDECIQLWGGMGFMYETPVGRRFCDQRLISIGGGSDEVMLQIISNSLGFNRPSEKKG